MTTLTRTCAVGALMAVGGVLCRSLPANAQEIQGFRRMEPGMLRQETGKVGLLFKVSRFYLAGATSFDMWTTVKALDHPTVARRQDGTLLAYYHGTEAGWAGFLGRRDARTAVAANVALNFGLELLSRKLYRRGGHWRELGVAINVLKGTGNTLAAIHNIHYGTTVNNQVRAATGYQGPIVWSH